MKEFFAAKKGLIAAIGGGLVAVVAAVVIILVLNKKDDVESYRTITVHEVEGTTVIKSADASVMNAFKGENLYNGDDATVSNNASITLCLDSDKYIYAESNAHFWLDAVGAAGSTKTVINTDLGDTLHHLENKLGSDEIYNVNTPASTMSVRGTVFRTYVYIEDGIYYTYLEVFQGTVEVELFTTDHSSVGVRRMVNAGECALMRASTDFSEFVGINDCSADENAPINYHNIPQHVALNLGTVIDSGEELSIGKDLLFDYVELTPHEFETTVIKEATCTEDGEQEEICTICGLSNGVEKIAATGHSVNIVVTDGNVCTDGITTTEVCDVCGEVLSENNEVSEHTYGNWTVVTAATCTKDGTEQRVCSVCEDKQTRTVKAIGHTYGNYVTVTNATCTTDGSEKHTCTVCGAEETRTIAAKGHSDSIHVDVVATCQEAGLQTRTCSSCGRSVTETIAKKSHNWSEWLPVDGVENCFHPGYYSRYCQNDLCDETESKEVPPSGVHVYNVHEHGEDGDGNPICIPQCGECGQEGTPVHITPDPTTSVCPNCGESY